MVEIGGEERVGWFRWEERRGWDGLDGRREEGGMVEIGGKERVGW